MKISSKMGKPLKGFEPDPIELNMYRPEHAATKAAGNPMKTKSKTYTTLSAVSFLGLPS
jgi:hypothetical protein